MSIAGHSCPLADTHILPGLHKYPQAPQQAFDKENVVF